MSQLNKNTPYIECKIRKEFNKQLIKPKSKPAIVLGLESIIEIEIL
jgi:hypothetical protein